MLSFVLKSNSFGTKPLKHAPIGWDNVKYSFKRSKDYSGITKTFIIDELGFIKDGKEYIKNIVNAKDILEDITLEIWKEINFSYEQLYNGVLDLTTYSEEKEAIFLSVNQSGFTSKFLNNDEIPIDISKNVSLQGSGLTIFPSSLIEIPLHSKVIRKTFEGKITDEFFQSSIFKSFDTNIHIPISFPDFASNELEVYNFGFNLVNDPSEVFETINILEDGFYKFDIDIYLKLLIFDLGGLYAPLVSLDYQFNDEPYQRIIDEQPLTMSSGEDPDYDLNDHNKYSNIYRLLALKDQVFNHKAGDKVKLYITFKVRGGSSAEDQGFYTVAFFKQHPITLKPSIFKITGETTFKETTCQGQLPFEVFTRICEAITDKTGVFESALLGRTDSFPVSYESDGDASLYLSTDGKRIRQLPLDEHPLYFTFKELFATFDAKYNIGVGIETRAGKEVVVIEKKEYFYNNVMIADLGMIADIRASVALEYYNNSIKIGYKKYENEVINGLDEIASEAQYITPVTQVKETYEKLAPYRSDGYGIEAARRLTSQSTKDSPYDKDNFMICLLREGEGFVTEQNTTFDFIENVISPSTIYNGRDTPARMLRRHGNMISPGLFKASGSLKYIKGEANNQMISKLSTESIQVRENADIEISELEKPLFIPRFHEFEHPAKTPLLRAIESNPYGYFQYRDVNNIEYKAFIENVDFDPNVNKAQFKLLLKFE